MALIGTAGPQHPIVDRSDCIVRQDLVERRFRTPETLRILSLVKLSAEERRRLLPSGRRGRGLWLLRDARAESTLKVVHASTARLLRRHQRSGRTLSMEGVDPGELTVVVARLVLDGVLEVETTAGYCAGPEALSEVLCPVRFVMPRHALARLSLQAVRYAADLETLNAWQVAQRLYAFNSWPENEYWRRRLSDAGSVRKWVMGGPTHETRRLLGRYWVPLQVRRRGAWRAWGPGQTVEARPRFKVYVSPVPDELPDVLRSAVRVLADLGPTHIKIGRDLAGVLRPDKLVVHVENRDAWMGVRQALQARLRGVRMHGVPLTAPASEDSGVVSWGIDPTVQEANVVGRGMESWRGRVARQLAAYLATARRDHLESTKRWRFALARLGLDGVDTERWSLRDSANEA